MSIRLYYAPMTRGLRPRWLLEEMAVPYDLIRVQVGKGEHRSPEYRRVHPLGWIPALVDGDLPLFESAAICLHLADRFPDRGMAPPPGTPERGEYYKWILFASTTLEPAIEPAYLRGFRVKREERPGVGTDEERAKLAAVAAPVAERVTRGFLLGERFGAADVVMGGVLHWAETVGLLRDLPELAAYVDRLRLRPAMARALAD
jgi:glutathione S-transferase